MGQETAPSFLKTMAKWKRDGIFIHPLFEFKCLGCRDPKATYTETGFVISNFPIFNDKPEEYDSYALDRTFKCDFCGFRIVFGIAVSKKHHDKIDEWMKEGEKKQGEHLKNQIRAREKLDEAKERVFQTA